MRRANRSGYYLPLIFCFLIFQLQAGNLQITSSYQHIERDKWLKIAYVAYRKGNYEEASRWYNKVLDIDPMSRNALLARAAISIQNNNIVAAINDYRQLLLVDPKDVLARSSLISVTSTEPEQSEKQLKLMIWDKPDASYLRFVLANLYGAQGRWQDAQKLYFVALTHNPQNPNYAYNLAVSLEHIARSRAAVFYYEQALSNIKNGVAIFNEDVVAQRIETLKNR